MGLQGLGSVAWNGTAQALRYAGKGAVGAVGAAALSANGAALVIGAELALRCASCAASKIAARLPNAVTTRLPTLTSEDPKTFRGIVTSWVRMMRMGNWTVQFGAETPRKLTNKELLALGAAFVVLGNAATAGINHFSCLKPLATNASKLVGTVLPLTLTASSPLAALPSAARALVR